MRLHLLLIAILQPTSAYKPRIHADPETLVLQPGGCLNTTWELEEPIIVPRETDERLNISFFAEGLEFDPPMLQWSPSEWTLSRTLRVCATAAAKVGLYESDSVSSNSELYSGFDPAFTISVVTSLHCSGISAAYQDQLCCDAAQGAVFNLTAICGIPRVTTCDAVLREYLSQPCCDQTNHSFDVSPICV